MSKITDARQEVLNNIIARCREFIKYFERQFRVTSNTRLYWLVLYNDDCSYEIELQRNSLSLRRYNQDQNDYPMYVFTDYPEIETLYNEVLANDAAAEYDELALLNDINTNVKLPYMGWTDEERKTL